jgi:hypothetical protein
MFRFERGGRQMAATRMRPDVVVVATPHFDADLGFDAIPKPLQRQVLNAELPVEGFVCSVLPRIAGIDERRFNLVIQLIRCGRIDFGRCGWKVAVLFMGLSWVPVSLR